MSFLYDASSLALSYAGDLVASSQAGSKSAQIEAEIHIWSPATLEQRTVRQHSMSNGAVLNSIVIVIHHPITRQKQQECFSVAYTRHLLLTLNLSAPFIRCIPLCYHTHTYTHSITQNPSLPHYHTLLHAITHAMPQCHEGHPSFLYFCSPHTHTLSHTITNDDLPFLCFSSRLSAQSLA